jgi:hypothetical protein
MSGRTSINEQKVNLFLCGFVLHVLCKGYKVAPVRTVVALLDMSFQPSMSVTRVDKIDLPPVQRSLWLCYRIQCPRLHTTCKPGINYAFPFIVAGGTCRNNRYGECHFEEKGQYRHSFNQDTKGEEVGRSRPAQ